MNAPYLNDKNFLKVMDMENHKEQFIRITVLDFQTERVKASIEGKSTGGNCNLSGTSNMRRTASCTLAVDPEGIKVNGYEDYQQYYNITEVENLISLNKKVRIETGFANTLLQYNQYDIIWYPLGTYVIKNANVSKNNSGINISLTLNDKCALLNGDMGGIIPAATVFSEFETYNTSGTERQVEKLLLKDVIKFLVVDFGGELPENVIITDIDDYIVKVMKWNGDEKVYLFEEGNKRLIKGSADGGVEYTKGSNIGYTAEPFVYPGTLKCNAGETVSSVLDKIRNTLGNFEWFYDVFGRFHFQKIKNYLNESITKDILELQDQDYLSFMSPVKSVYTFDESNSHLITSISNNPQYPNIKNDFVVWGVKKTATGADKPIRYHLAFQDKPSVDGDKKRLALVYEDYRNLQAIIPLKNNYTIKDSFPTTISQEEKDLFIILSSDNKVCKYDAERNIVREYPEYKVCALTTDDWRAELYYQGLWADNKTFSKNPYSAELNAEWPKIWNAIKTLQSDDGEAVDNLSNVPVYEGGYRDDITKYDYDYWLDFLEGTQGGNQSISQFNISKIGRRTKVINEKNINCLFAEEIPNYLYVNADGDVTKDINIAEQLGKEVIQVAPEVYKDLSVGGNQNAAFERVKELLYTYTSYNESISLSVIPIYHLEPNTRITVYDRETGIRGDYLIKTISLPLTINGTSTISATRCLEKTI